MSAAPVREAITVHLQYPICDLRRLEADRSDLKRGPNWEFPREDRHFIPYFGPVHKRRNDVPAVFADEIYLIAGKGGISFDRLEQTFLPDVRCLFRKLYSDGRCGYRYEIGLKFTASPWSERLRAEPSATVTELVRRLLREIPVRVKHINDDARQTRQLIDVGKDLTQLFRMGTTKHQALQDDKLVDYGKTGLLLELDRAYIPVFENTNLRFLTFRRDMAIAFRRIDVDGREVAVFMLFRPKSGRLYAGRELRIMILRMYFEFQHTKLLLNALRDKRVTLADNKPAFDYLKDKIKYFEGRRDPNTQEGVLQDYLAGFFELMAPNEAERLAAALESIPPQSKKRIDKFVREDSLRHSLRISDDWDGAIIQQIVAGKLTEALAQFVQIIPSEEALLLSSQYANYRRDWELGLIGRADYDATTNRITLALLGLIREQKALSI